MSDDKNNKENNIDVSTEHKGVRTLILSIATALFGITLFDVMFGFSKIIDPGISKIYNALGTHIEPNMITLVVFDWRGYDTLGESLILVTAVIVVLLVFGRGLVDGSNDYVNSEDDDHEDNHSKDNKTEEKQ